MSIKPENTRSKIEIPDIEYPSRMQFKTPANDAYVSLVGQAVYAFTYLEWQIVSIGEKIAPGFVEKTSKSTAGKISEKFEENLLTFSGTPDLKIDLDVLIQDFKNVTGRRNDLIHAHPATVNGEQRLHRWTTTKTVSWNPEDVLTLIHEVEKLAGRGNALFYDIRRWK